MYAFNPLKGLSIMLLVFIGVDYFLFGGSVLRGALSSIGFGYW